MHKQPVSLPPTSALSNAANGAAHRCGQSTKSKPAALRPLFRADLLYTQLSQLGLVTTQFDMEYRFNSRLATRNLLRQLVIIQKLYQGGVEDAAECEELRVQAMQLNTHLINTAGFGVYSNAARINILYQLRRILEKMLKTHFGSDSYLATLK